MRARLMRSANVTLGERTDVIVAANQPGVWARHCPIRSHAESKRGMHGMGTAVIVQP